MRSADDWLRLLQEVPDPEIPVLNIVEMGIVRNVDCQDEWGSRQHHTHLHGVPGHGRHRR